MAAALRAALPLLLACARSDAAALFLGRRDSGDRAAAGKQHCAELINHGAYHAVDVEVGTPGQRFSVVADTGSNTLIVPSCICQQAGYCIAQDACFTGTNKSSTFSLIKEQGRPLSMVLSFGSGQIQGVVARDKVRVGGLRTYMHKGFLLMTAKALNFEGSFEGILGLGIPNKEEVPKQHQAQQPQAGQPGDVKRIIDYIKRIMGKGGGVVPMGGAPMGRTPAGGAPGGGAPGGGAPMGGLQTGGVAWEDGRPLPTAVSRHPPSFLEQAGVTSFGICFNEGSNGVLRLGMPMDSSVPVHTSVGVYHWGLGLDGISVAGAQGGAAPLKVCSGKRMRPGQDTACGAIPDSGTTMITGPAEGVAQLLESLCDQWPRCRANHTALTRAAKAAEGAAAKIYGFSPFSFQSMAKSAVLKLLLNDCEAWLDDSVGLSEMPALHFHIAGARGTKQTLEMPASAYVMERSLPSNISTPSAKLSPREVALRKAWFNMTNGRNKVCTPAFGALEYDTAKNGPVWILGTPFFYEFNVGYDLSTTPPSLSLKPTKDAPCGGCDGNVGLVSEAAELQHGAGAARRHRPLPVEGEPRAPSFDVGVPL